jgi:hypothetical protein
VPRGARSVVAGNSAAVVIGLLQHSFRMAENGLAQPRKEAYGFYAIHKEFF